MPTIAMGSTVDILSVISHEGSLRSRPLQRDVPVLATRGFGPAHCLDQHAAGLRRVDDLVHDTELDRPVDTTGVVLMLGGELGFQLGALLVVADLVEPPPVEDADGGDRRP